MRPLETGDVVLREVALSLVLYTLVTNTGDAASGSPQTQRDAVSPALRLHDFAIKRRALHCDSGERQDVRVGRILIPGLARATGSAG